ncbi:DUF1995 family protein [Phormidium sp. CCY1219]|jgi:hypothetical protein|uniref:DUF1995 family protein n=1 Tax=Phormidium sp. CCY1219 TaxID=2886104 RepID=UPI002D1ED09A|nr:DUF1995 family protein [Phormidium sp. CCY1219]MEB3828855.1 DUF1995 family protein [Phormidium sp. CCY1219]
MAQLPNDLDEAIAQAKQATQAALDDGYRLLQVEIVIPELKVQPIAEQFIPLLADSYGERLKVYFPDAGAAALARRDWGETPYVVRAIGEKKGQIQPEDEAFLFVEPSSVEVNDVEKMCEQADDRPVILLLPQLENVATIGIGLAGRQLRERFLNNIESCYYVKPKEGYAIFRCYPSPWQVWLETAQGGYELISETPQKPLGDELDRILARAMGTPEEGTSAEAPTQTAAPSTPKQAGLMTNLKRFLRALSQ